MQWIPVKANRYCILDDAWTFMNNKNLWKISKFWRESNYPTVPLLSSLYHSLQFTKNLVCKDNWKNFWFYWKFKFIFHINPICSGSSIILINYNRTECWHSRNNSKIFLCESRNFSVHSNVSLSKNEHISNCKL